VTLIYDLLTLVVSDELSFIHPTHIPLLASYDYPFLSYGAVTAHAPCQVTWGAGKNYPHFWNPWPQFTYSLCHFHDITTKIKPRYRRKI